MRRALTVSTCACLAAVLLAAAPASAQESKLAAEVRRERERLTEKCGLTFKKLMGCATTIVTDHPFHLALGSLAPQNGFGLGLAFVAPQSKPNDDWRINWSADAVGTFSGGWRTGVYAKFIRTRVEAPVPTAAGGGTDAGEALPRPYPTMTVYGQVTSLPKVAYYGLGDDSRSEDRSVFAMRQSIVGGRVVWPFGRVGFLNRLSPVVLGEVNARWVQVGNSTAGSSPSIEQLYTHATAPGLDAQPATVQLGEGVRIAPAIGRLQLVYAGSLQQYLASDSSASFRRWTLDLRHEFALWTTSRRPAERETNSPNECSTTLDRTVGDYGCPDATAITTNRVGTVGFRALVSRSGVSGTSRVPFYFQRTIGGSDIDGERLLASYDDYRFRGPHVIVLQETFEHSIWGPIGVFAVAEQGRVALEGQSLTGSALRKTFGAGITIRAGGVPMITTWWARGGAEGSHVAITMNTSLFGGGSRPSLK